MNLKFYLKGDQKVIEGLRSTLKSDLYTITKGDDSAAYYLIFDSFDENEDRLKVVQETLDRFVAIGIIPSLQEEAITAGLGIGSSNIKGAMWPTIPTDLILAAHSNAIKSSDIEKDQTTSNKIDPTLLIEHRSYVLGAIFLSVAFLEATINNVFTEASDSNKKMKSILNEEVLQSLKDKWTDHNFERRTSMLEKYQIALDIIQNKKFKTDIEPYQSVFKLIHLRNEMMHFKSNWVSFGNNRDSINNGNLKDLLNYFEPNKFLPVSMPYFPYRYLSCGCAKWAVESSLNLTDDFFHRINLEPHYNQYRSRLNFTDR